MIVRFRNIQNTIASLQYACWWKITTLFRCYSSINQHLFPSRSLDILIPFKIPLHIALETPNSVAKLQFLWVKIRPPFNNLSAILKLLFTSSFARLFRSEWQLGSNARNRSKPVLSLVLIEKKITRKREDAKSTKLDHLPRWQLSMSILMHKELPIKGFLGLNFTQRACTGLERFELTTASPLNWGPSKVCKNQK